MLSVSPARRKMRPGSRASKLTHLSLLQGCVIRRLFSMQGLRGETNLEKLRLMNALVYDSIGSTSRASGAGISGITIRKLEGEY